MSQIDASLAYLHAVTNGKEKHLVRLISIFLETVPAQIEILYAELDNAPEISQSARKIIHKLRPALQSMGMHNAANALLNTQLAAQISSNNLNNLKKSIHTDWQLFFKALSESYGPDFLNHWRIPNLPD